MNTERYIGQERRQFVRLRYRKPLKYKVCKEDTIKKLLQIQWWNWPVEKIRKHMHLICSQKIDEFLAIAD